MAMRVGAAALLRVGALLLSLANGAFAASGRVSDSVSGGATGDNTTAAANGESIAPTSTSPPSASDTCANIVAVWGPFSPTDFFSSSWLELLSGVLSMLFFVAIVTWLQISRRWAYEGRQTRNTVLQLYFSWVWCLAAISLYAAVVSVVIPNGEVQPIAMLWWQRVKLVKVVLGEWMIEALVVFLVQRSVGAAALRLSIVVGGVSALVMAASYILTNHSAFGFAMPPVPCLGYGVLASTDAAMQKCVGEIVSYSYSGALVIAYMTVLLLRRRTERVALLLLLAILIIARSLDVLVMVHSCFDLVSLVWWSSAYPVGIFFVVRADSNFWRWDRLFSRMPEAVDGRDSFGNGRIAHGSRQCRAASDSSVDFNGHEGRGRGFLQDFYPMHRPRGDTLPNDSMIESRHSERRSRAGSLSSFDGTPPRTRRSLSSGSAKSARVRRRHRARASTDERPLSRSLPEMMVPLLTADELSAQLDARADEKNDTLGHDIGNEGGASAAKPPRAASFHQEQVARKHGECEAGPTRVGAAPTTSTSLLIEHSQIDQSDALQGGGAQEAKLPHAFVRDRGLNFHVPRSNSVEQEHAERFVVKNTIPLLDCSSLQLLRVIAREEGSTIWRGRERGKLDVAVKVVMCSELTVQVVHGVVREASILRAICDHPNIVSLHGVTVSPPSIWIVMEFCNHGTLFDRLHSRTEQPLTFVDKLALGVGICRGIRHLHEMQPAPIVHGDIKSSNIFLSMVPESEAPPDNLSLRAFQRREQHSPLPISQTGASKATEAGFVLVAKLGDFGSASRGMTRAMDRHSPPTLNRGHGSRDDDKFGGRHGRSRSPPAFFSLYGSQDDDSTNTASALSDPLGNSEGAGSFYWMAPERFRHMVDILTVADFSTDSDSGDEVARTEAGERESPSHTDATEPNAAPTTPVRGKRRLPASNVSASGIVPGGLASELLGPEVGRPFSEPPPTRTPVLQSLRPSEENEPDAPHKPVRSHKLPAIDIYSLAIVLWELITEQIPFAAAEESFTLAQQIMRGRRPRLNGGEWQNVPQQFKDIVQKCWANDPSDRPSARVACRGLRSIISPDGTVNIRGRFVSSMRPKESAATAGKKI